MKLALALLAGLSVAILTSCGQTAQPNTQIVSRQTYPCSTPFDVEFTLDATGIAWRCLGNSSSDEDFTDTIYVGLRPIPHFPSTAGLVLGERYKGVNPETSQYVPDNKFITGNGTQRLQLPVDTAENYWMKATGGYGTPYTLHRVHEATEPALEQRINLKLYEFMAKVRPQNCWADCPQPWFKRLTQNTTTAWHAEHYDYWMFENNANATMSLQSYRSLKELNVSVFDAYGDLVMLLKGRFAVNGTIQIPLNQLQNGANYFLRVDRLDVEEGQFQHGQLPMYEYKIQY